MPFDGATFGFSSRHKKMLIVPEHIGDEIGFNSPFGSWAHVAESWAAQALKSPGPISSVFITTSSEVTADHLARFRLSTVVLAVLPIAYSGQSDRAEKELLKPLTGEVSQLLSCVGNFPSVTDRLIRERQPFRLALVADELSLRFYKVDPALSESTKSVRLTRRIGDPVTLVPT